MQRDDITEIDDDEAAYERAEYEAEMYAENAWLRHAERPDPQDEYERELEARDPGLIWLEEQRSAVACAHCRDGSPHTATHRAYPCDA